MQITRLKLLVADCEFLVVHNLFVKSRFVEQKAVLMEEVALLTVFFCA